MLGQTPKLLPELAQAHWLPAPLPQMLLVEGPEKEGGARNRKVPGPRACRGRSDPVVGQTALPAFQADQERFQSLKPLSGLTVLSGEFLTITTSPRIELL